MDTHEHNRRQDANQEQFVACYVFQLRISLMSNTQLLTTQAELLMPTTPILRSALAAAMLTVAPAAALTLSPATALAEMSPESLVSALQEGGHVVFIRHASTEADYADQVTATMGDCSTQRTLSKGGWAEARALGQAFDRLEIPVGDVVSSEYCRAWQTADLAFGHHETSPALNFESSEDYSDAEISTMREQITPYLSGIPAQGLNTVLVGHDDPFEAATGIYPEPMGIAFILLPKGDGAFDVLGSIPVDAWPQDLN